MKKVGIIVEYNPLHNGHVHHINEVKRLSKCDVLVCVMSSSFTQRGEPAIIDKFTRTQFALANGVDLVVELPFVFTVQNADIFAVTSVAILDKIGVDEIYFGSENNNIEELTKLGEIMSGTEFNVLVKEYSKAGYSYPTANDMAMKELYTNSAFDQPNNILGIQYILAGKTLHSPITFHSIKRITSNYFDELKDGESIQSASAIRKLILSNADIHNYVPRDVALVFQHRKATSYEDFYPALYTSIKRSTTEELSLIYHVNEGLENRIASIHNFTSIDDLIKQLITKRYTNSKLKRTLAHILCNVKKTDIPSFDIPYIRILGMNHLGRELLHTIKHTIDVPLYTKIKEGLHPYIDIELRVSKLYSIGSDKETYTEEFKPVIY